MSHSTVFNSIKGKPKLQPHLNADVFEAAQRGDSESFGTLYDAYFEKIYRFLYYRTSHQQTAEDLAEEVFLKAFKNLRSMKGGVEKLQSWLYTVARHTVIDYYRAQGTTISIDELENITDYSENILDTLALKADQQRLISAIQQLPQEQQTVIKMRFLEEFAISEIATLLEKSEGNIRIIQFRALKKLREILSNP